MTLQTLIDRSSDEVDAWILEIFRVEEEIGRQSVWWKNRVHDAV